MRTSINMTCGSRRRAYASARLPTRRSGSAFQPADAGNLNLLLQDALTPAVVIPLTISS
jgi:hypothetical protein